MRRLALNKALAFHSNLICRTCDITLPFGTNLLKVFKILPSVSINMWSRDKYANVWHSKEYRGMIAKKILPFLLISQRKNRTTIICKCTIQEWLENCVITAKIDFTVEFLYRRWWRYVLRHCAKVVTIPLATFPIARQTHIGEFICTIPLVVIKENDS